MPACCFRVGCYGVKPLVESSGAIMLGYWPENQYFDDVSPLLRELPHFWLFFAPDYSPS
jgi:hypothetical protein